MWEKPIRTFKLAAEAFFSLIVSKYKAAITLLLLIQAQKVLTS